MIAPEILHVLCCPLSSQPLRHASEGELKQFAPDLKGALIRADGQVLYPIRNGIPLLVPGSAIQLKRESLQQ